mgnify:CR=1 FL=1
MFVRQQWRLFVFACDVTVRSPSNLEGYNVPVYRGSVMYAEHGKISVCQLAIAELAREVLLFIFFSQALNS